MILQQNEQTLFSCPAGRRLTVPVTLMTDSTLRSRSVDRKWEADWVHTNISNPSAGQIHERIQPLKCALPLPEGSQLASIRWNLAGSQTVPVC